jgi:hypothetical protein
MQNCLHRSGCQPPALPGRFAPYVQSSVALVVCWHCGIGQALCALFWLAASPCILYWPPPTPGLACFAASPARSSRPPPKGAPSEPRQDKPSAGGGLQPWVKSTGPCLTTGQPWCLLGLRGKVYACRHCHKLAYQTQREQPHDRACNRADTIRKRLGWEAGILNGNGSKPKGMHWQTFQRLQARHNDLVNQSLAGMAAKLGLTMARLGRINT